MAVLASTEDAGSIFPYILILPSILSNVNEELFKGSIKWLLKKKILSIFCINYTAKITLKIAPSLGAGIFRRRAGRGCKGLVPWYNSLKAAVIL